jgi:Flp pilus assembly protein TadD
MMHNELGQERKFVSFILPWLVAAAAFVVYLLTLNHWLSFPSLPYVTRIMGQTWLPDLVGSYGAQVFGPFGPLFFLVTYPLRWLPAPWIPLAMNLLSAICAALTLALLARSVALLPHDRTHEQRQREHSPFSLLSLRTAWIPPVLAVIVCGLQLSFWENATVASGAIFDLLLFAYIVRCLLEYRIDQRDSWLLRAALVYGAAITGDWLMIALLPAFVAALLWIKGLDFFNLRFLRGMLLCGGIGLLLYLLLPLFYVCSDTATFSFWQAFKVNPAAQKALLQVFAQRMPKYLLLLLATTSLVPVLLIGIRWSSYFGDPSKIGIALTTGTLHLAFATLLGACIWTAFDPVFSPRHRGLPLLTLNYLGALSVGYFIGYFLLVFKPLPDRMGRTTTWRVALHNSARSAVWALLLLVPFGLVWKNAPQIQMTNGPAMTRFASWMKQNLPDHGVLLSDDQSRLSIIETWIQCHGLPENYMFLSTDALHDPAYHAFQKKRHPAEWPVMPNVKKNQRVADMTLVNLVTKLSEQNPVFYLHPSFGYYFEFFYPQTRGIVMELGPYPTNAIVRPPTTAAEISDNEKFWDSIQPTLNDLVPFIQEPLSGQHPGIGQRIQKRLHIPFEPNLTASTLGRFLALSLDTWGVQLERAGELKPAAKRFETAQALNPNNIAARMNLDFNRDLQAGRPQSLQPFRAFEDEFGRYRNWEGLLRDNGPFDDPTHAMMQGLIFLQSHLIREAVLNIERVHQLVPDNLVASFLLARFYAIRAPDQTLELISEIRTNSPESLAEAKIQKPDLAAIEATALFSAHRTAEADHVLQNLMDEYPENERLLAMVAQISTSFGRFTNALIAVQREVALAPTNSAALVIQGYLNIQLGNFKEAIGPLTRALSLETNNYAVQFPAQLDRAIAYLRADRLAEAEHDYLTVLKINPNSFQIYYGLGEIAWRRKDTNAAIANYQLYLTNSVPDSDEAKMISERLQSLQPGAP